MVLLCPPRQALRAYSENLSENRSSPRSLSLLYGKNAQSAQVVSVTSACGWIEVSTSPNLLPLTTAASILFAAAVGVCVALSQLVLAVGVTVLVLVTLRGLGFVEHWLGQREND